MIDLHCHILPGVDDGALDVRDSAGMARQAANDGIEAICATPHIRHDHDVRIHPEPHLSEDMFDRIAGLIGDGALAGGVQVDVVATSAVSASTVIESIGLGPKTATLPLGAIGSG